MALKKVTDLALDASPTVDDLILTVNTPGTVPASKHATLQGVKDLFLKNTAVAGVGSGGLINFNLGTALAPLGAGDVPILIDHHTSNATPGSESYAIKIITNTTSALDMGSGLVVVNKGKADGVTFAVDFSNVSPGASACAIFNNNVTDVEQYSLVIGNRHGKGIILLSYDSGEGIDIRKAGTSTAADKSAHIIVRENVGNFGHRTAYRFDSNAAGVDTDIVLEFNKNATPQFRITQLGSIGSLGTAGFGTLTPTGKFEVVGTSAALFSHNVTGDGKVYIINDSINGAYSTNANGVLYISFYGYNGDLAQFRDTIICNGKGATVVFVDGSLGTIGLGSATPAAKLSINGGLHVGGDTDPGDNNLLVDGTAEVTGISLFTGLVKTVGGLHVGGAADPGADNLIVDGTATVVGAFGCNSKAAQTAYVSGGALPAYGAGAFGLDSNPNMSALHAMVVAIRACLVSNGIMS